MINYDENENNENRSHRYGINSPRHRHRHKRFNYTKYEKSHGMIMFVCIKWHLQSGRINQKRG